MSKQPHARKKCGAKTRTGKPCKNGAMDNGRCRMHGGKSTGAPKENKNSMTHGLFAKYLPKETLAIMDDMNDIKPLNILWTNIQMQFASIIRAQQIMFVDNQEDHTTFKTKEKEDDFAVEEQYEIHTSWDKQASFMNSLSRSMAELRNMLKQYVEMANYDDDRLLEIKRMQSIVDKNNAEIDKLNKESKADTPPVINIAPLERKK